MNDDLVIRTTLGESFAQMAKGEKRRDASPKSNLRALCILINKDIDYYNVNDQLTADKYDEEQSSNIKNADEIINPLYGQVKVVLDEKNIKIPDKCTAKLEVIWPTEHKLVLMLMRLFIKTDEIFHMLEISQDEELADNTFIKKQLRSPAIGALQQCFRNIIDVSHKYAQLRNTGLYSIKIK